MTESLGQARDRPLDEARDRPAETSRRIKQLEVMVAEVIVETPDTTTLVLFALFFRSSETEREPAVARVA